MTELTELTEMTEMIEMIEMIELLGPADAVFAVDVQNDFCSGLEATGRQLRRELEPAGG